MSDNSEVCSRCRLPEWSHELWKCTPWHMGEYVGDDEMRREVVLREINQGALAGMPSEVTEQAADLILAMLNRYDEWKTARLSAEPDAATVERVAQAVYEEDGHDDWTDEWYQVRRNYHRLARAAIAAMRTPAPEGEA